MILYLILHRPWVIYRYNTHNPHISDEISSAGLLSVLQTNVRRSILINYFLTRKYYSPSLNYPLKEYSGSFLFLSQRHNFHILLSNHLNVRNVPIQQYLYRLEFFLFWDYTHLYLSRKETYNHLQIVILGYFIYLLFVKFCHKSMKPQLLIYKTTWLKFEVFSYGNHFSRSHSVSDFADRHGQYYYYRWLLFKVYWVIECWYL